MEKNIACEKCGHPKTHKHGDRRRKCPACGKTFTPKETRLSENGRPPEDGEKAKSNAERQKKWRTKKKNQL